MITAARTAASQRTTSTIMAHVLSKGNSRRLGNSNGPISTATASTTNATNPMTPPTPTILIHTSTTSTMNQSTTSISSSSIPKLTPSSPTSSTHSRTSTTTSTPSLSSSWHGGSVGAGNFSSSSPLSPCSTCNNSNSNNPPNNLDYYDESSSNDNSPQLHFRKTSSIGSDVEMIAANDRMKVLMVPMALTAAAAATTTALNLSCRRNLTTQAAAAAVSSEPDHASMPGILSDPKTGDSTVSTASTASTSSAAANGAMKDEYGVMDDAGDTYVYPGDFALESGQVLTRPQLRYRTYGTLNATRDNVLVVCHALTGNASLHTWWGDLLGPQQPFDTDRYFVVCCNILGSCYGSTGSTSINPATGLLYRKDFPDVSVRDTVRLQLLLLQQELQVRSIKAVIGGSFGGMQAVEFAVQGGTTVPGVAEGWLQDPDQAYLRDCFTDPDGRPFVRMVIPIACGAQHTAWQIGISEVQRQAIYKDPAWNTVHPETATAGLEIARQLGMISYRTPIGFVNKFGRAVRDANNKGGGRSAVPNPNSSGAPALYGSRAKWQVKSYLEYQGRKFLSRFDPVTYVKMTEQMDSHDVARGRGGDAAKVLGRVEIPALVMGIDSDVLYPLYEQEQLAEYLPHSDLRIIHSDDGHDGFLLEQEQVGRHITDFLDRHD